MTVTHKEPGVWVKFERIPQGWKANIRLRLKHGSDVSVSGVGGDEPGGASDALLRAGTLAFNLSQDPVMQLLLPPGASQAILATKIIADASKGGILKAEHAGKSLWKHFTGAWKSIAKGLDDQAQSAGCGAIMGGQPTRICEANTTPSLASAAVMGVLMGAIARRRPATFLSRLAQSRTNPYASMPLSANAQATNPWAPFPVPNPGQSPAALAPPTTIPPPAAPGEDPSATPSFGDTPEPELDAHGEAMDPSAFADYFGDPTNI